MKPKTTLALLVMVIIGAIYVFLIDARISDTETRAAHAARAIRFDPDRVSRLEIERGSEKLVCVRRDGEWVVVEPYQARADSAVINRMLASLYRMEHSVTISRRQREDNDLTLADYGLLPPKVVVRFEGDNFRRLVNVGSLSHDGELLYVTLDNTKGDIYGVNTALWQAIPPKFADARSRRVFDESPASVNRIDVKTKTSGFVSLALSRSGEWMLAQPFEARADEGVVKELLEGISRLNFNTFIDGVAPDNTLHGFDEVDLSISLRSVDDVLPREVLFGSELQANESLVYARYKGEQSLFSVGKAEVMSLLRAFEPARLRDRRVIADRVDDIAGLRIGAGTESIEFHLKDDGHWSMVNPRRWRAERPLVEEIISAWSSAEIHAFIPIPDGEDYDEMPGATKIAFATSAARGNAESEAGDFSWRELEIGGVDEQSGLLAVRKQNLPWIYMVSVEQSPGIPADPLYYRDRTVLSIAPGDVQSITLRKNGREQVLARSAADDRLMVGGLENGAERRGLDQSRLFELLSSLRCARYIPYDGADSAELGLAEPRCSITLVLRGDAGISNTILIGKSAGDGLNYARVRGQDVAFLLDDRAVGIICSDLYITVENND